MNSLFAIALGGATGALLRHFINGFFVGTNFPWHTLIVNILGSFILAACIETFALKFTPPPELRAFLIVGFCGALTTFSTFALDTFILAERAKLIFAVAYISISVIASLSAFAFGLFIIRKLFA